MKLRLTDAAKEELRGVRETKRSDSLTVRVFVKGYG